MTSDLESVPELTGVPPNLPAHMPGAAGLAGVTRSVEMENVNPLRLRLLLEIERTGSISGAAEACGIRQPSASMHLRMLETAIGHRLVVRGGRGSSLTVPGMTVASHASRVLSNLDSMRRAIDALDSRGGGQLILAASLMPSMVLIPRLLRQYRDLYPAVSVNLRTQPSGVVVSEIERSGADLGIAGDVPMPANLTCKRIFVDQLVGIAPQGLLSSNGGGISPGQLAQHSLLIGGEASSTRMVIERYLAHSAYRPARIWVFDSCEAIKRAVADGLGVSFVSRHLVREEIERGELASFRVCGIGRLTRPIYSVQSAVKDLTPQGAAFMALLANVGWPTIDETQSE